MKNKKLLLILGVLILLVIVVNASNTNKNELGNIFSNDYSIDDIHITINPLGDGDDIYTPIGKGYRYGPSIICYDDGSADAWFSSPGNNSTEWDYIRYRHSDDGINWSDEKIVLRPSAGTNDHYSTCDPGVIYFDGYYYLGYTSTLNKDGYDNDIYVARSTNPDGPYEKWNGSSWGGNPVPIVDYTGDGKYWGAGEISFCVVDDHLYCYYTWMDENGSQIKFSKADLCENWPATMSYGKTVIGAGSCEALFLEEYDKVLLITIQDEFCPDSSIGVFESNNGEYFLKTGEVKENIHDFAHNVGVSKNPDGSIGIDDRLIIGYSYSKTQDDPWGKWSTHFQGMKLQLYVARINEEQ